MNEYPKAPNPQTFLDLARIRSPSSSIPGPRKALMDVRFGLVKEDLRSAASPARYRWSSAARHAQRCLFTLDHTGAGNQHQRGVRPPF